MPKYTHTIVTTFFDIGRDKWEKYGRTVDKYLENAKRMMSLKNNMVIYIQNKFVDFVKKNRKGNPTVIIPIEIEELPAFVYFNRIKSVMESIEFKNGLKEPSCPEVNNPFYDVIMFSKLPLIIDAIDQQYFPNTTRWIWMDFGIHEHMLQSQFLNKYLFDKEIPEEIKILCRSIPQLDDLNLQTFFKSQTNRLAGTCFSGSEKNMRLFDKYAREEINNALSNNVVDCDQSFFNIVYLKHQEIFKLYYGDWEQIFTNYFQTTENTGFVLVLLTECIRTNKTKMIVSIINSLPKEDKNMVVTMCPEIEKLLIYFN
jgi:protein YibB